MTKRGIKAVPAAQGKTTPETDFVLGKFGVKGPRAHHRRRPASRSSWWTTPIWPRAWRTWPRARSWAFVDHHKLGDVTTPNPLEMWVWPAGCTCTVIASMYDFYGIEIPKAMAGIMLCAILSDTVMFKSPTCTPDDKKACDKLAKIAGVADMMALGMEMFKVKSAVDGTPIRELVFRDYKDFSMSGTNVGIGQLEVVDLAILDKYKADLQADIAKVKAEKKPALGVPAAHRHHEGRLGDAHRHRRRLRGGEGLRREARRPPRCGCPGVMSRKKDVVPKFEKVFGA